jgi:hypothetical protein
VDPVVGDSPPQRASTACSAGPDGVTVVGVREPGSVGVATSVAAARPGASPGTV